MLMFIVHKGCTHCKGDLVLDDEELMCIQCGRYRKRVIPFVEPENPRVKIGARGLRGGWHHKYVEHGTLSAYLAEASRPS